MNSLNHIKSIDIYFLDQLIKGRLKPSDKILDAGCGSGRNIKFLIQEHFNVFGVDDNKNAIEQLKLSYPKLSNNFTKKSIEKYNSEHQFDFIICNAVLHFAKDHDHFDELFAKLVSLLSKHGTLFIRMTTDIGIKELLDESINGVYHLPDNTLSYLVTKEKITSILSLHQLQLTEPIKTVVVDGKRSMATLVFKRN
jgi:tellurite methyltransferase